MTLNLDRAVLMLARVEIASINNQHDQSTWAEVRSEHGFKHNEEGDLIVDEKTGLPVGFGSCATAFCAAGWALTDANVRLRWYQSATRLMADKTVDGEHISDAAAGWLGMDRPRDCIPIDERDEDADTYGDDLYDNRWNYEEDMPHLFNPINEKTDLYEKVAEWWDDGPMPFEARVAALETLVVEKVTELQTASVSR